MATYGVLIDTMDDTDILESKAVLTATFSRASLTNGVDGEVDGAMRFGSFTVSGLTSAAYTPPVTAVSGTHWAVWSFWFQFAVSGAGPHNPQNVELVGMGDTGALGTTSSDAYLDYSVASGLGVKYESNSYDYPGVFFAPSTWYHIEYAHRFGSAANGNYALYVNGNEVATGVGDSSGEPWVYALISGRGTTGDTYVPVYDHVVCVMSDDAVAPRLGMLKTARYAPTGTAQGQWLGSDADSVDNHLLLANPDRFGAGFITSTAGSNEVDRYTHGALPSGAVPFAVQPVASAMLDTPGTDDFGVVLESNGTSQVTPRLLGAGPDPVWMLGDIATTDPDGGGAWTKAKVDATTFGVTS